MSEKPKIAAEQLRPQFETRRYKWYEQLQVYAVRALIWSFGLQFHLFGAPLRAVYVRGGGRLAYYILGKMRRIAFVNLDLVYGEELTRAEKKRIVLGMFRHFGRMLVDFIWTEAFYDRQYLTRMPFHGVEYFHECINAGRGAVAALGHLGNWEVGGAAACMRGFHLVPIFKPLKAPVPDYLMGLSRKRYGFDLIRIPDKPEKIDEHGNVIKLPRPSLMPKIGKALLEEDGLVAILADQYPGAHGTRTKFLGVEAPTFVGPVEAARRFNSPLLVSVCVYENGEPVIYTEPPLAIEEMETDEQTLVHNTERVNALFEKYIRRYPEQYAWGHRRFDREHYKNC